MNKAVVIDLDGTLLRCNTFREWLLWSARRLFRRGNIAGAAAISWWVLLRKLRLISHAAMKDAVMRRLDGAFSAEEISQFAQYVYGKFRNVDVEAVLSRHKGDFLLLATAAPVLYAAAVGKLAGVDAVIASQRVDGRWVENMGSQKAQAVERYLADHAMTATAVIADHADDIPLMQALPAAEHLLVNPSPRTVAAFDKAAISYNII